jgi:hypothetical protein
MPDDLESLCDLVELQAVKDGSPLDQLWKLVFAAIRDGKLDFAYPDEFEREYGGRNPPPHLVEHIRRTRCVNALFAIENGDAFDPWKQGWVRRMLVSRAAFDEWPNGRQTVSQHKSRPGPKSKKAAFLKCYNGERPFSYGAAAKEFGVHPRTIGRWVTGK